MPEIFGVSWGMYAILGALVVILVLLLVISRRRKSGGASPKNKQAAPDKTAQGKRSTKIDKKSRYAELQQQAQQPGAPVADLNPFGGAAQGQAPSAAPTAPQPPVGYDLQQLAPSQPVAPAPLAHSVPVEQFMPDSDPLNSTLFEVLSGWGEITQEDTNRLGIFRPDRISTILATVELPKELRNSDQARARLSQLRRWASGLEQAAAAAAPPQAPAPAPAVAPAPAAAPVTPAQTPAAPPVQTATPVVEVPPAQPTAPLAAVDPAAAAAAAAAAAMAPVTPQEPPVPAAPETPQAPAAPAAPSGDWKPAWEPPGGQQAPAPGFSFDTATPQPMEQAPPAPSVTPEPTPGPPVMTPAAPPTAPGPDRSAAMLEATKSTEAAIAAAAAAFWARPENSGALPEPADTPGAAPAPAQPAAPQPTAPAQPAPAAPPQGAKPVGSSGPGGAFTFMGDLSGGATTAEGVLALPAAEQAGALAFLKPTELSKVLQMSGDAQLKSAAIEQLQSIGSPEALAIIRQTLGGGAQPQT